MPEIRVRIAPSPSGYLHIGTARAALYNWLFAHHHQGKFLLRIEDTDTARSSPEMVQVILDSLKWLGLESDEPVVYQSQRLDIHKKYVDQLLKSGKAYRCWCEPELLRQKQEQARAEKRTPSYDRTCYNLSDEQKRKNIDSGKPFAIRLFLPEGETTFKDLIVGEVTRKHEDLDDFIIARSDGRAVYNMAVVADDHEMGITHVIRGNDHISNTFKQILIYDGLGLAKPQFAHIPLILGKNKAKMSKRDGAAGVTDYAKMGYLKDALINFIALLGWSPGDDREVMSLEEMIDAFSLDRINPANAVFDIEKLTWMNGEYIRKTENYKLVDLLRPFLVEAGLVTQLFINTRWDHMVKFVAMMKERCHLLTDFVEQGYYLFSDNFNYEEKGVQKHFSSPEVLDYLKQWQENLETIEPFDIEHLEQALRNLAEKLDIKPAMLIHPTRLALSGTTKGPSLFEMMEFLGKDQCLGRIARAIKFIDTNRNA
jgi:nondiscriminating glutamyl-tRNA synthetase